MRSLPPKHCVLSGCTNRHIIVLCSVLLSDDRTRRHASSKVLGTQMPGALPPLVSGTISYYLDNSKINASLTVCCEINIFGHYFELVCLLKRKMLRYCDNHSLCLVSFDGSIVVCMGPSTEIAYTVSVLPKMLCEDYPKIGHSLFITPPTHPHDRMGPQIYFHFCQCI